MFSVKAVPFFFHPWIGARMMAVFGCRDRGSKVCSNQSGQWGLHRISRPFCDVSTICGLPSRHGFAVDLLQPFQRRLTARKDLFFWRGCWYKGYKSYIRRIGSRTLRSSVFGRKHCRSSGSAVLGGLPSALVDLWIGSPWLDLSL